MVRKHQDAVVVKFRKPFQQRLYDLAVDELDGFYFIFDFKPVAAFVGRLDMHIYEVLVLFQLLKGGFGFASEVRVDISCRSFHVDCVKAGANADSFYKINGGYDGTVYSVFVIELRDCWFSALAPEPYGIGGTKSAGFPCPVYGMVL